MQIVDLRKSRLYDTNGVTILNDLSVQLRNGFLNGLDKISLWDTDYEKEQAMGRWRINKRTNYVQYEIMFDTFDKFSHDLLKEKITHYF